MELTKTYLKDLTYKVTGAAIEVHKRLGPGLLWKVFITNAWQKNLSCVKFLLNLNTRFHTVIKVLIWILSYDVTF